MSDKNHRSGGKFGGKHTTVIPAAGFLADKAAGQGEVTKVIPGFITAGLSAANGQRRVKITYEVGCILLSVRDNTSHQEIRVLTSDIPQTSLALSKAARDEGLHISFTKGRERSLLPGKNGSS